MRPPLPPLASATAWSSASMPPSRAEEDQKAALTITALAQIFSSPSTRKWQGRWQPTATWPPPST